jgi:hypothetical protein
MLLWLTATVASLAAVVWSGIRRRRRTHYAFVLLLFTCLAGAIREAELYGRGLRFEGLAATVYTVHMTSVAATFATTLVVLVTGVRLARARGADIEARRPAHRVAALVFVTLVVITCVLGTTMTLLAERR